MKQTKIDQIVADIKTFDWQKVIDYANSLGTQFNDAQWRFLKGLILERAAEIHSNDSTFKYVGETHCDFRWGKYKITVEQKSKTAGKFYTKKNKLKKTISFILTNSYGTNNTDKISSTSVSDVLIGIASDGVVFASKDTVLKYLKENGEGFVVNIPATEIVEITGHTTQKVKYESKLAEKIIEAIDEEIIRLTKQ